MKHGKINFSRDLILGKEELQRFRDFSDNKLLDNLKARLGSGETRNIFTLGANDSFEVTKAVADNTVDVTTGNVAVLNKNPYVAEYKGNTDFALDGGFTPADGDVRYLCLSSTEVGYEIDATVSVTGTSLNDPSGNLSGIVRGLDNYDNTKIKFLKPGGTLVNTGSYDVIEVVDATNITLSHDLTTETGLKPVIIGTYDLTKVAPTAELYTFTLLTLGVYEGASITDDLLPIAKITWSGATTFTINNNFRFYYDITASYLSKPSLTTQREVIEKRLRLKQHLELDAVFIREPAATITLDVTEQITVPYEIDGDVAFGSNFRVVADGANDTISSISIDAGGDIPGYDLILTSSSGTVKITLKASPSPGEIGFDKDWTITLSSGESAHLMRQNLVWRVLDFPQTSVNLKESFTEVTYNPTGGWSANTTYGGLYYRKNIDGTIDLQGGASASSTGNVVTTLPEGYRPTSVYYFSYYNPLAPDISVGNIATNGEVTLPTNQALINLSRIPLDL